MPARLKARQRFESARAILRGVRRRLLLAVASVAISLLPPLGVATAGSLADDFVESWTTRDGLPHSTVNGIGQTSDGYLWLASWEGIARYNGHEFQLYRREDIPGLGDDSVRAVHVGPTGDLWAGSARGGIVRWHGGHWQSRGRVSGLVTDLLEEPGGRLWIATARGGVVRMDPDGARHVVDASRGLPSDTVNALARDARGRVWVATSGGLAKVTGDRASPVSASGLPPGPVFALASRPDGRVLAATEHGALVGGDDGFAPLHPGLSAQTATRLWLDPDGIVWVGTNNAGLARVDGDRIEWLDARHGLPNNRVLALRRDREGSLWVGTNGGLARIRSTPIHTYTRQGGLADDFIRATLATRDGSIWIGGGQGLDRIDPKTGAVTHLGAGTALAGASVLSLAADTAGDLYVGTFHDGLIRLRGDRVVESISMADGLPSNEVRAVLPARDGRLWIGTKQGVVLRDAGKLRVFGARDGLPAEYVQALREDATDTIWVGTSSGAAVIRGDRATPLDLSAADAQYVYDILPARDMRSLWLATDRGLLQVDANGRLLHRVGRAQGLPFEKIFATVADAAGRIWLTGNEGIARLRMTDLEAVAAGRIPRLDAHLFGRADGMATAQANGGSMPGATLDASGRLWVATAIGVARLDPAVGGARASTLPPISVERFEVDGRALDPAARAVLPPGDHRLVVRFVAPALVDARRVRYRYRLDGLAPKWIELGDSRELQFTHLDPRDFRLHLQARLSDEPAHVDTRVGFSIRPYWWQRPLVWVALGAAAMLLLASLYVLRIRALRRTARRLRALVEERTIALRVQTQVAERLARTDALTQLANRRALDQALEQGLAELAQGHPMSLLLVDVDGFKPINDLHGHAAGDVALQAVAGVIAVHAREQDVAARWGGDEFALLLVGCPMDDALGVAERIRAAVAAIDCSPFAPGLAISASVGVACGGIVPGVPPVRTLVPRADEALYRAKREGRNRVCGAVEPERIV
ncbi:two-component regulator propeller domain-containing protein [Lysobacter xanthus]